MAATRRTVVGIGLVGVGGLVLGLALSRSKDDTSRTTARDEVVTAAPHAPAQQAPMPSTEVAADVAAPPESAAPTPTPTPTPTAPASGPTVEDIFAARADDSPEAFGVLLAGVESDDAVVVAEASLALVAREAVAALPALLEQDVLGRPWAAPSVIDALGRLGARATPEERSEVVDHLVALLHAEKRRGAVESQGNLLQIYEALGHTGDPRAIPPLEQELVDPTVRTAPKVVVVQALVALHATQSRGVLEQLHAELAAATPHDAFEAELQNDLLAAIRDALVKLS